MMMGRLVGEEVSFVVVVVVVFCCCCCCCCCFVVVLFYVVVVVVVVMLECLRGCPLDIFHKIKDSRESRRKSDAKEDKTDFFKTDI
jgi:hypothetical protein